MQAVNRKAVNDDEIFPYALGITICLCPFLQIFFETWGKRIFIHYSVQVRAAMNGLIYNKVFEIDLASQNSLEKGKLISLISNDSRNASDNISESLMILTIPAEILFVFIFVVYQLRWAGLIAECVLILVNIPQFLLTYGMHRVLHDYEISNDSRNRMVNETMQGIKVVKLTGLEAVFIERLSNTRGGQLTATFRYSLMMQTVQSLLKFLPCIVFFAAISVSVRMYNVTQLQFAVKVMPSLSFLRNTPISQATMSIQALTFTFMGISRVRDFLILPNAEKVDVKPPTDDAVALTIDGGAFTWAIVNKSDILADEKKEAFMKLRILQEVEANAKAKAQTQNQTQKIYYNNRNGAAIAADSKVIPEASIQGLSSSDGDNLYPNPPASTSTTLPPSPLTPASVTSSTSDSEGQKKKMKQGTSSSSSSYSSSSVHMPPPSSTSVPPLTLHNVDVVLPKGTLTMVVGGVGCGKTSFASALIGEMPMVAGETRRSGTISYCPQQPWITNDTVRSNITFGSPFDEERYLRVVRACALEADMRALAAGDLTMLAEMGANLSGGQKARIQLARCVYSDRDICVLDDVLSAVDAVVGRFLLEECICTHLAGKTRVLTTNQLQYLDRADHIIVLGNGGIAWQGTYEQLACASLDFAEYVVAAATKGKGKKNRRKGEEEGEDGEEEIDGFPRSAVYEVEMEEEEGGDSNNNSDTDICIDLDSDTDTDIHYYSDKDNNTPKDIKETMQQKQQQSTTNTNTSTAATATTTTTTRPMLTTTPIPATLPTLKELERGVGFTDEEVETAKIIMTEEEYSKKSVSWATYGSFLLSLMHPVLLIPYFLLTFIAEVAIGGSDYWMGIIGKPKVFKDIAYWNKIWIYGLFVGVLLVVSVIRTFWSGFAVRRSNRIIHNRLLTHVLHAPPSFFDTTPLGRILNRFSAEISQTDQFLHVYFMTAVYFILGIIRSTVIVGISTPVFLTIGGPALLAFAILLYVYSSPSRNLQRADSIARSPVISLFQETVTGAGVAMLKVHGLREEWTSRFNRLNDDWTARREIFRLGLEWARLYTSVIGTIFMTGVIFIGWYFMDASDLAVAVQSSVTFGIYALYIVTQVVELDARMTSYERVEFFSTHLPQESSRSLVEPPPEWPTKGAITFDHVRFRYRPGLPFVLRDVSFRVQPGETVGVCGRTGAGKSSLLYAIFRLVELDPVLMPKMIDVYTGLPTDEIKDEVPNSGRVLIDDVDISEVSLARVRQSVSVIPQNPTLFTGSVRYNLDLSYKCTDAEIYAVLDLIQMRRTIDDLPQGLDTSVVESGANFSCGQRQLLCFGRAILNHSRIIILDEATASVDVETDAKIQDMVHNNLKNQTVIVIAHRLNTIMNSDKIMVLDKGSIIEFDSPDNLRADPSSAFNTLLKGSSD